MVLAAGADDGVVGRSEADLHGAGGLPVEGDPPIEAVTAEIGEPSAAIALAPESVQRLSRAESRLASLLSGVICKHSSQTGHSSSHGGAVRLAPLAAIIADGMVRVPGTYRVRQVQVVCPGYRYSNRITFRAAAPRPAVAIARSISSRGKRAATSSASFRRPFR